MRPAIKDSILMGTPENRGGVLKHIPKVGQKRVAYCHPLVSPDPTSA